MTGFDASSRKLKRRYLKAIKAVWRHQRPSAGWERYPHVTSVEHQKLIRYRDSIKTELERRDWDV